MLKRSLILSVMILLMLCVSAPAARRKKSSSATEPSSQQSDSDAQWHKLTSSKGDVKTTAKFIKFQPTTGRYRVTISSKANGNGVASTFRAALMECTALDQNDKPGNWKQVEVIYQGEPKNLDPKEFDNGLDKDGKQHWLSICVWGQKAHYEITIEDQGSGKRSDEKK
jgi:hypothetical protein